MTILDVTENKTEFDFLKKRVGGQFSLQFSFKPIKDINLKSIESRNKTNRQQCYPFNTPFSGYKLQLFNPTTQDEIAEIAKTFLPGKAAGYDQIPMTFI